MAKGGANQRAKKGGKTIIQQQKVSCSSKHRDRESRHGAKQDVITTGTGSKCSSTADIADTGSRHATQANLAGGKARARHDPDGERLVEAEGKRAGVAHQRRNFVGRRVARNRDRVEANAADRRVGWCDVKDEGEGEGGLVW